MNFVCSSIFRPRFASSSASTLTYSLKLHRCTFMISSRNYKALTKRYEVVCFARFRDNVVESILKTVTKCRRYVTKYTCCQSFTKRTILQITQKKGLIFETYYQSTDHIKVCKTCKTSKVRQDRCTEKCSRNVNNL